MQSLFRLVFVCSVDFFFLVVSNIQITVTEMNWFLCAGGQRSLHRGSQVYADSQGTACLEVYS